MLQRTGGLTVVMLAQVWNTDLEKNMLTFRRPRNIKDWKTLDIPRHGANRPVRCLVYHAGEHVYLARRAFSSKRDRYHVYAIPDGGLAVPVRIANEVTLGEACLEVHRHVMAIQKHTPEEVLVRFFSSMQEDVELARMILEAEDLPQEDAPSADRESIVKWLRGIDPTIAEDIARGADRG